MQTITKILIILIFVFFTNSNAKQKTYCNPINIYYGYCPIPNFVTQGKHRATADPVIVNLRANIFSFQPINMDTGFHSFLFCSFN